MISLRFVSQFPPAIVIGFAALLAIIAWWLYRRELRQLDLGWSGWWLPTLRSLAILLIVLTLAEPVVESRKREGEPGRVLVLLDGSESMSAPDGDATSRFERAAEHLIHPLDGLLPQLASEFEVSVRRFGDGDSASESSVRLWESNLTASQELPASAEDWLPTGWSSGTALGDSLTQALEFGKRSSGTTSPVVVLMSDGRSNVGASPVALAEELAAAGTPLFTVGYGPAEGMPDLVLLTITSPERLYRTDVLNGTLTIADHLAVGTPFTAEVLRGTEVVWRKELISEGRQPDSDIGRAIPFSVAIDPLFEAESKSLPQGVEYSTLPLQLNARLSTREPEANVANNERMLFLSVASQKSRLLLVDGRSRWETRYLRNVFSRDPAWQVDTVLAQTNAASGDSNANHSNSGVESNAGQLPQTRAEFNRYNLIIVGDVDASLWREEQLNWLSDFVQRGGGLIFIDGARQFLRSDNYASIIPLLPIRWQADASSNADSMSASNDLPKQTELTPAGAALDALRLTSDASEDNSSLWKSLPPLQFVSQVEALPGSEVLVEAVSNAGRQPLLITRRFGAGRVLFTTTDETWRWRYRVADLVHQRFWNQLARWSMRVPMSVQGEFVSLDTGPASITLGQAVEVRCSLRELDGEVASERTVSAVVRRDGKIVARIPLAPLPESPGAYSGEIRTLPAGDYAVQIEAAGYPRDALEAASKFSVVAPQSVEMQELTKNEALLEQLASITGGEYVAEDQVAQLIDMLRPMSGGRITQSATILWQSYWWFVAALLLLIAEWILRKRSGLI